MLNLGKMVSAAVAAALAAGCASGESGVLDNPSSGGAPFEAGRFLPAVNTVDSGKILLTNGEFDGGGENLVFTEPFSTSRVRINDSTEFTGADQIYDTDGDLDYDYIILTLRALSAQAARSVTARDDADVLLDSGKFYKIAGIAILPVAVTVATPLEVTLPVNAAGAPVSGKEYQLYRWNGSYSGPGSGLSHSTGAWEFVSDVTVDSTGNTVTFSVSRLGEYAIASNTITVATAS